MMLIGTLEKMFYIAEKPKAFFMLFSHWKEISPRSN